MAATTMAATTISAASWTAHALQGDIDDLMCRAEAQKSNIVKSPTQVPCLGRVMPSLQQCFAVAVRTGCSLKKLDLHHLVHTENTTNTQKTTATHGHMMTAKADGHKEYLNYRALAEHMESLCDVAAQLWLSPIHEDLYRCVQEVDSWSREKLTDSLPIGF